MSDFFWFESTRESYNEQIQSACQHRQQQEDRLQGDCLQICQHHHFNKCNFIQSVVSIADASRYLQSRRLSGVLFRSRAGKTERFSHKQIVTSWSLVTRNFLITSLSFRKNPQKKVFRMWIVESINQSVEKDTLKTIKKDSENHWERHFLNGCLTKRSRITWGSQ